MLELKLLEKNEIDPTGTKVYLTDATGLYAEETNEGGYGDVNFERNTVVVFPLGYYMDSKGGREKIDFETNDPLTSKEWVAKVRKDSWLQFSLVYALTAEDPLSEDYSQGDVVFSMVDYALLQKEGEGWKTITPYDLESSELESKKFEQFHIANLSITKINLNRKITELYMSSINQSNSKQLRYLQEEYDRLRTIIQAAVYQFCIGNKYQAQEHLEFLLTHNYEQLY
jgi:hypothetical protein